VICSIFVVNMNLCELFLVILLVLIDGCFLLDSYLVIVLCVICVYVLVLTKFPWMFGWVLGLRFVHFDTVFENFSLCTSGGPINSFLTSFDGVLPILLLVVGFPFQTHFLFVLIYLMCVYLFGTF